MNKVKTLILFLLLVLMQSAYTAEDGGFPGIALTSDVVTNFSDFTAGYLNPAVLTQVDQKELSLGINMALDIVNPMYASIAIPFGMHSTAAFTLMRIGLTGIQRRDSKGTYDSEAPSNETSEYDVQASIAHRLLPFLSAGLNATVYFPNQYLDIEDFGSALDRVGDNGVSIDAAIRLHPIQDYLLGKISLGISAQNIFAYEFKEDQTVQFNKYPANFRFQFAWYNDYYRNLCERIEISSSFTLVDLLTSVDQFNEGIKDTTKGIKAIDQSYLSGVHLKYFPIKMLGLRAGLTTNRVIPLGISFNYKHVSAFRHLQIDLDYGLPLVDDVDPSYAFKLATRFGKTREEYLSENKYRVIRREPMIDFDEAMKLYLEKKFWQASFAFGKVLVKWPTFSKVDVAAFYMAKSYEYMHMNDVARDIYAKSIRKYTTSDFRPKYIFQLQNLDYKEGKYDSALIRYNFISNLFYDSDIRPDADYVAGQIFYQKKEYPDAIRVLEQVEEENSNYLYAQYTLAMIHMKRRKYDNAIVALENVSNIDSTRNLTISEQSLKHAASTKLGQLFYENKELVKSMVCFSKVNSGSRYYTESQLGIVWCYISTSQNKAFSKAINTADNIVSSDPNSFMAADAYLAMGYAYTMLGSNTQDAGMFTKAIKSFDKCISLCNQKFTSRDQMEKFDQEFKEKTSHFSSFTEEAFTIAMHVPTPALLARVNDMNVNWESFNKIYTENLKTKLKHKNESKFKKNALRIKKDAEFALATAMHLKEAQKKIKIRSKAQKKNKKVDDELKQLEQELKEMEE